MAQLRIKFKGLDLKEVEQYKENIRRNAPRTIQRATELAKTEIAKRTLRGELADGSRAKPYSKSYARQRAELGKPTNPVSHFFKGDMLGSMQTAIQKVGGGLRGKIFFPASQRKKVQSTNKLRPWFGIGKRELKVIRDEIKKLFS